MWGSMVGNGVTTSLRAWTGAGSGGERAAKDTLLQSRTNSSSTRFSYSEKESQDEKSCSNINRINPIYLNRATEFSSLLTSLELCSVRHPIEAPSSDWVSGAGS